MLDDKNDEPSHGLRDINSNADSPKTGFKFIISIAVKEWVLFESKFGKLCKAIYDGVIVFESEAIFGFCFGITIEDLMNCDPKSMLK